MHVYVHAHGTNTRLHEFTLKAIIQMSFATFLKIPINLNTHIYVHTLIHVIHVITH